MKNTVVKSFFLAAFLCHVSHAQEASTSADVTGVLQQVILGSRAIVVAGKSYEIINDVEFLGADLHLLARPSLSAGTRVKLRLTDGRVTHVIVNPTAASQFDQPNK